MSYLSSPEKENNRNQVNSIAIVSSNIEEENQAFYRVFIVNSL